MPSELIRWNQDLVFAPRAGIVGAVVGVGVHRFDEFQFEYLDLTHPHVTAALICVDPRRRPSKTDGVSGILIGFAAHSLALMFQPGQQGTVCRRNIM